MLVVKRLETIAWRVMCFAGIAAFFFNTAMAKLMTISLAQLVQGADLVLYGQTIQHRSTTGQDDHSIAWIKPITILKDGRAISGVQDVPICNGGNSESVDFNSNPGTYIVFVSKEGSCYSPIAGLNSVVVVKESMAHTKRIDGQPAEQGLDAFLAKISTLVNAK